MRFDVATLSEWLVVWNLQAGWARIWQILYLLNRWHLLAPNSGPVSLSPEDFKNQHLLPQQQVAKNYIIDGPPCVCIRFNIRLSFFLSIRYICTISNVWFAHFFSKYIFMFLFSIGWLTEIFGDTINSVVPHFILRCRI